MPHRRHYRLCYPASDTKPQEQYQYYRKAELTEEYLMCIERINPRHADTRWEAPQLAGRLAKTEIVRRYDACREQYEEVFGFPDPGG